MTMRISATEMITDPGDPLPAARVASPAAIVALRSAFQEHLRRGAPDAELQAMLRLVCDVGRRAGLHAEHLLVIIKEAWASLPDARRVVRSGARDRDLDRIVTMCIAEFYAAEPPSAPDAPACSPAGDDAAPRTLYP